MNKLIYLILTIAVMAVIGTGIVVASNLQYIGNVDATLSYTVYDPGAGLIGITEAEISGFRQANLLSVTFPTLEWGVPMPMTGDISVTCDFELVFAIEDKFRVFEGSFVDREVTIRNLPPGERCRLDIDLVCDRCVEGPQWTIYRFDVPNINGR